MELRTFLEILVTTIRKLNSLSWNEVIKVLKSCKEFSEVLKRLLNSFLVYSVYFCLQFLWWTYENHILLLGMSSWDFLRVEKTSLEFPKILGSSQISHKFLYSYKFLEVVFIKLRMVVTSKTILTLILYQYLSEAWVRAWLLMGLGLRTFLKLLWRPFGNQILWVYIRSWKFSGVQNLSEFL